MASAADGLRSTVARQLPAVLRPGDSLTVVLQGIPDPSTNSVQIDDQGLISLPFIGSTKAAGVTTSELSRSIRAEYLNRRYYTAIDVSVSIAFRLGAA